MKRERAGIFSGWAVCLWIFFSGCESSLDFQFENLPKLTIVAHVSTGSWERPKVFVYASQSPSDSSRFYTPAHLNVTITEFESNTTIRLDSSNADGRVFFEIPQSFLRTGFTYRIIASAPGFETINATTAIPKPSMLTDLSIRDLSIEPSEKDEFKSIVRYKLVFNISHYESNRYYHLVFYNQYADLTQPVLINPELSDDQIFLRHYDFGILLDREDLIPGEPLNFNFVDWIVEDGDIQRIFVELRTISEEYYKYHSTLARQLIIRQDPFAEPVTIFNNIEGGYGNFSGFSPDVYSSVLPQ